MNVDVATAMQIQSDQRKQLETLLALAHKSAMETGGLPADSSDLGELYQLTLGTISHSERIARSYAKVASQAAVVARASLEVAKTIARELPDKLPESALRQADGAVARLEVDYR